LSQKNDSYQPKSVIWRSSIVDHLSQVQGVLDFDSNFDNMFQKWKLAMEFTQDVGQLIEQGLIPIKKKERWELMPNQIAIDRMNKIWNENTYLRILKNKEQTQVLTREFFYTKPSKEITLVKTKRGTSILPTGKEPPKNSKTFNFDTEVIRLPKLKNMIPVGEIKEDVWGIKIRETMVIKYAWEGANYGTIVNDGNFTHYLSDGSIPKFEADDMESESLTTYVLHRPVYHAIMDILPMYFNKNYFVFSANVQKLKDWLVDLEMEGFEDFLEQGIYEEPE